MLTPYVPSLLMELACVCVCVSAKSLSCVWLFTTLWLVACQVPLPTVFSRQEYWSGLPCPAPGNLPDPGIKPVSLTSPALAGGFFTSYTYSFIYIHKWASLAAQKNTESLVVKNVPAMQKTQVQSLGQEDPLEKGMATHGYTLQNSCLENFMDNRA